MEALEEYRLEESEVGRRALKSGRLGRPLLVQRLDRLGDFYYLTPWQQSGKVTALIDVDARFGVFKSMAVLSTASQDWAISAGSSKGVGRSIAGLLENRLFELPEERGRIKVYPDTYCIPPILVWKPCRESWSPHLPFYHIVVGGNSLYVRIDGPVFTQLTTGRGV